MHNSVPYPILRHMISYTNDQQLHQYCHLMTTCIKVCLQISSHGCDFDSVMRCMLMLHDGLQVDEKCTQITLDISRLLHIQMQTHDTCH